jgi:hypothetical protein
MPLRASYGTELQRLKRGGVRNYVLNEWFGHSGAIAEEHYLLVTEGDYAATASRIRSTFCA